MRRLPGRYWVDKTPLQASTPVSGRGQRARLRQQLRFNGYNAFLASDKEYELTFMVTMYIKIPLLRKAFIAPLSCMRLKGRWPGC